ncbi:MAG: hypothetical protein HYX80_06060 [Chloroflexi bacterium]|nr:hypothetical protein [Chloroflexota bacterium]
MEYRKRESDLPDPEKLMREPWSMASLLKDELPPESIPSVIKVWRYAINTHEEFTIRHARWVSRLYCLFNDTEDLWYYSAWYCDIETSAPLYAKLLKTEPEPNTFMPDTTHFLSPWENMTLNLTNQFKRINIQGFRPILQHKDGNTVQELLHFHELLKVDKYAAVPDACDDYYRELFNLIIQLPSLDSLGFDYDSKMVYLRLYTYLIRGSKWRDLSPRESVDLIRQLRQWVFTEHEKIKSGISSLQLFTTSPWPYGILLKAGYETPLSEEETQ